MSYLKDREIWLSNVPTGNPPAGYFWKFIQNGKVVVRDSSGNNQMMIATSGSQAITGSLTVTEGITGTVSSASYVEYSGVANKPTLVSGSSQITYSGLTGIPSGIISGSAQLPTGLISGSSQLPSGIVSSSVQVTGFGFATTGSNAFIGTQTITGSLYISSDLVVQGSSSLQNITASAVNIGANIVNLNTANPAIRFAGLNIFDSGSIGGSGSFLYDAVQDEFIFVHRGDGTNITSSVVLMGPQTYNNIGSETYPTANRILKGVGNEHIGDSCIIDDGTTVCVNTTLKASGQVCSLMGTFSCVGIGTGTPATPLHISTTGLPAVRLTLGSEARVHNISGVNNGRDLNISPFRHFSVQTGNGIAEGQIVLNAYEDIILGTGASYTPRLTISPTGAATFSNSIYGTSALFGSDFLSNETSKVGISFASGHGQINSWGSNTSTYGGLKFQLSVSNGGTFNALTLTTAGSTFSNTETTLNFNPQTNLLASYYYLNFGGGSIMYRNTTDIYFGSNAKYGSAGTVVANYTSANGMGLLTMDGGMLRWQANNTSVTAGTAYSVPIRFAINGDGNVGIGTATPNLSAGAAGSTILTVSATTSARNGVLELNGTRTNSTDISGYVRFFNNGAATPLADIRAIRGSSDTSGDLAFTTADNERMRIDSGGTVQVKSGNELRVYRSDNARYGTFYTDNNYVHIAASVDPIKISSPERTEFYTAGVERMRISSTGVVTITHPSSDAQLSLSAGGATAYVRFANSAGDVWGLGNSFSGTNTDFQLYNFSTAAYGFRVSRGGIYANTTGAAANVQIDSNGYFARSTSSLKYKNSITNYDKGLDIVNQLRPVYYKGNNDGDKIFAGLIAEEVHDLGLTEFVQYAEDGTPDALAYSHMVALLTKGMQEQQTLIESLKSRIEILEQ